MRGNSEITAVKDDTRDVLQRDVTWLSPDAELWVASSSTDFVGVIEFRDGHFVARDCRNRSLGSFSDLRRAKIAVQQRWETRGHVTFTDQLAGMASRLRAPSRQTRSVLAQGSAETVA